MEKENREKIIKQFNDYVPLNESEITAFIDHLVERKIKRKQFILQEGDYCKHFHYVVQGCFKMYGIDDSGVEHNLVFAAEGDWIADINSLYKEKTSLLYIEAIEPSIILQISKENLFYLYANFPKIDRYFRVVFEDKYIELQNRLLQTLSTRAQMRYESFLEQYPKLANRLPNTQIASYLGITPEFLSKIRNERALK